MCNSVSVVFNHLHRRIGEIFFAVSDFFSCCYLLFYHTDFTRQHIGSALPINPPIIFDLQSFSLKKMQSVSFIIYLKKIFLRTAGGDGTIVWDLVASTSRVGQ